MIAIKHADFIDVVAPIDETGDAQVFTDVIAESSHPHILRGGASHWRSVEAACSGDSSILEYLMARDTGTPVYAIVGQPDIEGRFGYTSDFRRLNHKNAQVGLSSVLEQYPKTQQSGHAMAVQAAPVRELLRDWEQENPLDFPPTTAAPTIWISNPAVVATHADSFDNIACVAAGSRRFTLFPPEIIGNLSLGPLVGAPGGVPVSTLDYTQPQARWSSELAHALDNGLSATLQAGDVIFIPALWWHGVEALASLNVLVNYWWGDEPTQGISPYDALSHAILAISRLPREKRERWQKYFDHLVFRLDGEPGMHLPEDLPDLITVPGDDQGREVAARIGDALNHWAKR